MNSVRFHAALDRIECPVATDDATRRLYATDASLYQIEPVAVAFPRGPREALAVIEAAVDAGISITPRGAGTGLVGGAIGDGLVIDFARHNRAITNLNADRRTVRVGPGVVLDELNAFLKPHALCFGPDVATSSRATLGGMIANNSSGARVPRYGTTADHVLSLDIVLADGRFVTIGSGSDPLPNEAAFVRRLVREHQAEIDHWMPPGLLKRWPGYALDRMAGHHETLVNLICGSEGTLAAILGAELRVLPLPQKKGLGLIFFDSVIEAMEATVALRDLEPVAIEHIDRILFDQTKGRREFEAARSLLELDTQPCESILLVEFYEDVTDRLQRLAQRHLGRRSLTLQNDREMSLVWALRKAGLSLLTSRKGSAKPVTGIEDTAVRPEQLPAYVRGLEALFRGRGVEVCYYGHAAAGLLHIRPVLDLKQAEDRQMFRNIADEVSSLVRQFQGSLAGEHGVGIARTEYLADHVGPQLVDVMSQIKSGFDPKGLFNPGKIISTGRFRIDQHLRAERLEGVELPFAPVLAYAPRDGSFLANLEQCNGCGGCRKATPSMCPTFVATGEEAMSTRGRANMIRAALELRTGRGIHSTSAAQLREVLATCLSCKACALECPSNVDMALLKAELLHAQHQAEGLPLFARLISWADPLGKFGCTFPSFANAAMHWPWFRRILAALTGLSARRPLPRFAEERFDHWFDHRPAPPHGSRGRLFLWDDTFTRYYDPQIGRAAVAVLEAAGYEVNLLQGRVCCGRPAFSQGRLDQAAHLGQRNLHLLRSQRPDDRLTPIVFLEPSCYSMFKEDYRELQLDHANEIAERSFLFEEFLDRLLQRHPAALPFGGPAPAIAIHTHCHTKSLGHASATQGLLQRLPGARLTVLDTGCCGMAGAFGMTESKVDLSLRIAEPLIARIRDLPSETTVVASGTSCRMQIQDLAGTRPRHLAEVLAESLAPASCSHRSSRLV